MMFVKSRTITVGLTLLLALAVLTGCSQAVPTTTQQQPITQPATTPATQPAATPASTADANILKWDAWQAKMVGTINKDYYVVDLRTPAEIKLEKSLEGSINIDANETLAKGNVDIIDEKLAGVPKDATILIHCKSGKRSKDNLAIFIDKGYTNTFALAGWTVFDAKGFFQAAAIDPNTEQLKPDAWQAKMQGTIGQDYFVLDVRDKEEYEAGHIEGALNFGVRDQFTVDHAATITKVNEAIPNKDALILVHCAAGVRAKVAQAHLKADGYTNVLVLDNKITIDQAGNVTFE